MEQSKLSTLHYYRATREASQADKPALLLEFCRAAIAECERGELSLWQVGTKTLALIGGIDMPNVELLSDSSDSKYDVLEKLYGVAGGLDLAEQGGTTQEADEKLWLEYKALVHEYAKHFE